MYAALFSYLFLVSLTIFHYHHVDMNEGNYAFANYSDTGESPFDKIIDLTHECMIQQFAGTVINLTHLDGLNLLRLNNSEKFSFTVSVSS